MISFQFISRTPRSHKNISYFIPDLIHYLHSYIKGFPICQLSCNEKPPIRQLQTRITINYRSLLRLSYGFKGNAKNKTGHKYILCIIHKVPNYLITAPIHQSKSEEI